MKRIKDILNDWKEKKEINNFVNSIEEGFNYYQNKYNPKNHLEIYTNDKSNYTLRDIRNGILKGSLEIEKQDLKEETLQNNYHKNMNKVNYFDITDNSDYIYDLKDNPIETEIKDRLSQVNKKLEEIKQQISIDKSGIKDMKCYRSYNCNRDDLFEVSTLIEKDALVRDYNLQDDDTYDYRKRHTYKADIYKMKDTDLYFLVKDDKHMNGKLYTKDYMEDYFNVDIKSKNKEMER